MSLYRRVPLAGVLLLAVALAAKPSVGHSFGLVRHRTLTPTTIATARAAATSVPTSQAAPCLDTDEAFPFYPPPATAPTAQLLSGGGIYVAVVAQPQFYVITFVTGDGETTGSPQTVSLIPRPGFQEIRLTGIPLGPLGTIARNIYAYASPYPTTVTYWAWWLAQTLPDDTTTTWLDDGLHYPVYGPTASHAPPTVNTAADGAVDDCD